MRTALASLVSLVPSLALAEAPVEASYGQRGVFELGANAGMMLAPDFHNINVAPIFGWFVADNLELAAIFGIANIEAGDQSSTVWDALVEPSYHIPIDHSTFGFLGMGVGTAYVSELGVGLAVAPRIGAKVMVGDRGVLTQSLSYEYTTHNVDPDEMKNVALVAVSSALRLNIGYTTMW